MASRRWGSSLPSALWLLRTAVSKPSTSGRSSSRPGDVGRLETAGEAEGQARRATRIGEAGELGDPGSVEQPGGAPALDHDALDPVAHALQRLGAVGCHGEPCHGGELGRALGIDHRDRGRRGVDRHRQLVGPHRERGLHRLDGERQALEAETKQCGAGEANGAGGREIGITEVVEPQLHDVEAGGGGHRGFPGIGDADEKPGHLRRHSTTEAVRKEGEREGMGRAS